MAELLISCFPGANAPLCAQLLPPELKDEFKSSGIPVTDLETREDWILLLNCFFFGSARQDYRPLNDLLHGTQRSRDARSQLFASETPCGSDG